MAAAMALVAGCAPGGAGARIALSQFLHDVHGHQAAYAYNHLAPAAAATTNFNAFNDAVLASRASFRVVSVRSTSTSSARAVVVATGPGGRGRRVILEMVEVGTGGDWMVAAPFVTGGAAALRRLAAPAA